MQISLVSFLSFLFIALGQVFKQLSVEVFFFPSILLSMKIKFLFKKNSKNCAVFFFSEESTLVFLQRGFKII